MHTSRLGSHNTIVQPNAKKRKKTHKKDNQAHNQEASLDPLTSVRTSAANSDGAASRACATLVNTAFLPSNRDQTCCCSQTRRRAPAAEGMLSAPGAELAMWCAAGCETVRV